MYIFHSSRITSRRLIRLEQLADASFVSNNQQTSHSERLYIQWRTQVIFLYFRFPHCILNFHNVCFKERFVVKILNTITITVTLVKKDPEFNSDVYNLQFALQCYVGHWFYGFFPFSYSYCASCASNYTFDYPFWYLQSFLRCLIFQNLHAFFSHHLASVVRHLSSVNFSHQVSDAGSGEPLVFFSVYDFDLVIYYSMMLTKLTCTLYFAICT